MMGSWGIHKPSNVSVKERIITELYSNFDCDVLQASQVGNILYFAIKHIPSGTVYAEVVKTRIDNSIYNNLIYKQMDETMQPYFYDAPASLIKKLTPTDSEQANEWRKICLETAEKKKTERGKPKLKDGDKIKFTRPIQFSNGSKLDTFTVWKEGRRTLFIHDLRFYRIRKWNTMEYEVVV